MTAQEKVQAIREDFKDFMDEIARKYGPVDVLCRETRIGEYINRKLFKARLELSVGDDR